MSFLAPSFYLFVFFFSPTIVTEIVAAIYVGLGYWRVVDRKKIIIINYELLNSPVSSSLVSYD